MKYQMMATIPLFLALLSSETIADNLPPSLADLLQQRAVSLDKLSLDWRVDTVISWTGVAGEKPGTLRFTKDRRFVRNGDATSIAGQVPLSASVTASDSEFYVGDMGVRVEQGAHRYPVAKGEPDATAYVWACTSDSVRIREPFQEGLNLAPEDFVMLTGFSPLGMYRADWILLSQTPKAYNLEGHSSRDNFSPLTIRVTLDRTRDNIPTDIRVDGSHDTVTYHASQFRQVAGTWLASDAVFREDFLHAQIRTQHWTLGTVSAAKSIVVSAPAHCPVQDYRLVGVDLTTGSFLKVWQTHDPRLAEYTWPGHLPSQEELRKAQDKIYPGEATPDPVGKTSLLPTVGGAFCLVGGILLYRRRGNIV